MQIKYKDFQSDYNDMLLGFFLNKFSLLTFILFLVLVLPIYEKDIFQKSHATVPLKRLSHLIFFLPA